MQSSCFLQAISNISLSSLGFKDLFETNCDNKGARSISISQICMQRNSEKKPSVQTNQKDQQIIPGNRSLQSPYSTVVPQRTFLNHKTLKILPVTTAKSAELCYYAITILSEVEFYIKWKLMPACWYGRDFFPSSELSEISRGMTKLTRNFLTRLFWLLTLLTAALAVDDLRRLNLDLPTDYVSHYFTLFYQPRLSGFTSFPPS